MLTCNLLYVLQCLSGVIWFSRMISRQELHRCQFNALPGLGVLVLEQDRKALELHDLCQIARGGLFIESPSCSVAHRSNPASLVPAKNLISGQRTMRANVFEAGTVALSQGCLAGVGNSNDHVTRTKFHQQIRGHTRYRGSCRLEPS